MAIWDDYQQYQSSTGQASDAAKAAAQGTPSVTTTSGNQAWRDAQAAQGKDPAQVAQQQPQPQPYTLPAVNQLMSGNPSQFTSLGAPFRPADIPQPAQYQGGIGASFGQASSELFKNPYASIFTPQQQQPSQPIQTGYHWYKGTGGVSGGNDANMDVFYNNGTKQNFPAITPGEARPQLPQIQYTLPGVNANVRSLTDPSVGALKGAERFTNQFGQNVVNPNRGGQITSGSAYSPSYGSLAGSTEFTDNQGMRTLNTPQGGQIEAGASRRKPSNFGPANQGQVYLGGFY